MIVTPELLLTAAELVHDALVATPAAERWEVRLSLSFLSGQIEAGNADFAWRQARDVHHHLRPFAPDTLADFLDEAARLL